MKKFSLVLLTLFVALTFAGCASSNDSPSSGSYETAAGNSNRGGYSNASTATVAKDSGGGGGGGKENPQLVKQQVSLNQAENSQPAAPTVTQRKIIRNAEMTLETEAPEDTQGKITAIAESKGGFVIESQRKTNDTRATKTDLVTMTVRVPAAKFDEALAEIRKTASRIIVEDVKGQDVTEEFIDIEARLKAQRALEAQFLEIMKQAKTVQDALNVQRQIAEVRGEIEKVEGRKRFLENQSEFSTLRIKLQTPTAFSPSSTGFFYQLNQAFSRGFNAALGFILLLVTFVIAILPFLIFIVLPIYLVIRYFLRKGRKQPLASEIVEAEIKNE